MKNEKQMNSKRRNLLLGSLGAGAAVAVLPSQWSTPVINAVLTPAHAQASVCPMIVIMNVTPGPSSGAGAASSCVVSFDVVSGDSGEDLSVTNISNTTPGADSSVSYEGNASFSGPVDVSASSGTRITWEGPVVGGFATCLANPVPVDDITFTVTATCGDAAGGEFSQDFALAGLLEE